MSLHAVLAELRADYRAESTIERLVQRQPPVTRTVTSRLVDGERHFDVAVLEEPAAAVGMSLSGAMVSLIGGIREDAAFYGPHHPLRAALSGWERVCRREHRQVPGRSPVWNDHARGPLCAELLWAAVRDEYSVAFLSQSNAIAYPRIERILWRGIEYVQRQRVRLDEQHDRTNCSICRAAAG